MSITKEQKRLRVKRRVRKNIFGTVEKPRLSVYRSNKEIYAQIINDVDGVTLASASSKDKSIKKGTKTEKSAAVGKLIADKAKKAGIENVIFDRNGFLYHGRVKSLAEGAREGGLQF